MTVKLNITLDETTVKRIKLYAEKRKTSVSKIVERQLTSLLENEVKKSTKKKRSFSEKYAGLIKDIKIEDINTQRNEYLKKKHGL